MARDELILVGSCVARAGLFAFRARRRAVDALDEDHCIILSKTDSTQILCSGKRTHDIRTYDTRCDTIMSAMSARLSKIKFTFSGNARSLCRTLLTWPAWRTSRLILSDSNLRGDARVAHFKTVNQKQKGNVEA